MTRDEKLHQFPIPDIRNEEGNYHAQSSLISLYTVYTGLELALIKHELFIREMRELRGFLLSALLFHLQNFSPSHLNNKNQRSKAGKSCVREEKRLN